MWEWGHYVIQSKVYSFFYQGVWAGLSKVLPSALQAGWVFPPTFVQERRCAEMKLSLFWETGRGFAVNIYPTNKQKCKQKPALGSALGAQGTSCVCGLQEVWEVAVIV